MSVQRVYTLLIETGIRKRHSDLCIHGGFNNSSKRCQLLLRTHAIAASQQAGSSVIAREPVLTGFFVVDRLEYDMLFFRERPDEIFHALVHDALAWLKNDLTQGETDPHMMNAVLPKTARMLTLGPTLATVDELLEAIERPEMYELTPMHRLILSEALERYCKIYNAHPQDTAVHARYEIDELDPRRMLTIFLAPFDAGLQEAPAQARAEALQMSILADAPWRTPIRRDLSLWYRKGEAYPAGPSKE